MIEEQALSLTGATKDSEFQAVGELLNGDYILLSKLQYLGNGRYCHMRIIDCKSGIIMSAARVKLL